MLERMKMIEKAMNEEIKGYGIIIFFEGEEDGKLLYRFNYTELNRTNTLNITIAF